MEPEKVKAESTAMPAKEKTIKQEIMSWILTLLAAMVAALLIRAFLFDLIRVDGESMRNTLQDGELVLVTKAGYRRGNIERGDVVICHYPDRNSRVKFTLGGSLDMTLTRHTLFVKRLIALPGDTLEIREGVVYVNSQEVDESGIDFFSTSHGSYGPVTLGEDDYFVMGDNRGYSNDSRRVGFLSRDMIVGHVKCVLWPLNKLGKSVK